VKKYLTALRLKEIIGKSGFFMVGVLFAQPAITFDNILRSIHFLALCLINGLAIYLLNAYFGYQQDQSNERLVRLRTPERSRLLVAALVFTTVGLVWVCLFSTRLIIPALIIYVVWIIYSIPNGLKRVPVLGLVCAFVGQFIHFHLGYLVFADEGLYSILLAVYFALLFAGGHALHEVIDHDADKEAGLKTSSVYFGRGVLFQVSNGLFALAAACLLVFGWLDLIGWNVVIPYELAFLVQVWLVANVNKSSNATLFVYRRKYMIVFVVSTVVVGVLLYSNR
jgi:4-hydroxybenzoate polyprenyltransferase